MKILTIYGKPGCQYCAAAKEYLDKQGIEYRMIDISENEQAREWLIEQGYKSLPVIFAGDEPLMTGTWNVLKTMRKHEIIERLAA